MLARCRTPYSQTTSNLKQEISISKHCHCDRWQKVRSFLYGTQEQTQPPVKPYGIQQQQKAAELLASTYLMREGRPNFDIRASRSIWASSNPGYVFRDGKTLRSVAKSDYSWNEEEVRRRRLCFRNKAGMLLSCNMLILSSLPCALCGMFSNRQLHWDWYMLCHGHVQVVTWHGYRVEQNSLDRDPRNIC